MRKPALFVLQMLLLGAVLLPTWTPVQAGKMKCSPIPVTIVIRPGDGGPPATVDLSSQGLIPIAVLSDSNFDATQFSPQMVHVEDATMATTMPCSGASAVRWTLEDVNKDGKLDLVFFFKTQELNLTTSSTAATLMAHGLYTGGTTLHIMGTESVVVVP